jgi:energy-converting hydrogenase Eha subunit G
VSTRQTVIVAAVIGLAYTITLVVQGGVAPGLVGGALAGVLVFLLIRRVQEHNAMRRRRARGRSGPGDA